MNKKLIELTLALKDKLTPALAKGSKKGVSALGDLGKQAKKTTMEIFLIAKAGAKFQISLEKQIVALKGQAKALRDPAVQKKIKEVERLTKANAALRNSIVGVSKSTKTNTAAMKGGTAQLLKYAKAAGGLLILREIGRLFVENAVAAKLYSKSLIALNTLTAAVGLTSKDLVLSMQKATKSQISLTELTAISNRAIALLGEQAIPQFKEIAEVAAKSAQVMGTTVAKAFNDFVIGAGRQSRLILDNLGLIVSATKANENYAFSLGKTVDELTETERKQAFLNEALKQARQKYRDITIQADAVAEFNAKWADMKIVIGDALLPTLELLANLASGLIDGFRLIADNVKKSRKEFELYTLEVKEVNDEIIGFNSRTGEFVFSLKRITVAVKAQGDQFERMRKRRQLVLGFGGGDPFDLTKIKTPFFEPLLDNVEDIEKAFRQLMKSINPNADAIKNLDERAKELRRTLKELRDPEIIALIRENQKLEKQISGILNPSINKTVEGLGLWERALLAVNQAMNKISDNIDSFVKKREQFRITFEDVGKIPLAEFGLKGFKPTVNAGTFEESFGLPAVVGKLPAGKAAKDAIDNISKGVRNGIILASGLVGAVGAAQRGGGTLGVIQSLLPAIGEVVAPGIGGPIGAGVAGIISLFGKKRRGETPQTPLFVSDINLTNQITELLNAVKSQILISTGRNLDRISGQLRAQALADGVI